MCSAIKGIPLKRHHVMQRDDNTYTACVVEQLQLVRSAWSTILCKHNSDPGPYLEAFSEQLHDVIQQIKCDFTLPP